MPPPRKRKRLNAENGAEIVEIAATEVPDAMEEDIAEVTADTAVIK